MFLLDPHLMSGVWADRAVPSPTRVQKGGGEDAPRRVTGQDQSPSGRMATYDIILDTFEDGGYETAIRFMPPIRDPGRSRSCGRRSVAGGRGLPRSRRRYEQLNLDSPPTRDQTPGEGLAPAVDRLPVHVRGKIPGGRRLVRAGARGQPGPGRAGDDPARLMAVLGIVAMRRGEIENCLECLGPSSCIFPIAGEAVHRNQAGSREAIEVVHGIPRRSRRETCGSSGC